MSDDIEFVDGLFFNQKHENAPDFVIGGLGVDRKALGNWLRQKTEDKINLDIKISKGGKPYISVSTWKPDPNKQKAEEAPAADDGFVDNSIPF